MKEKLKPCPFCGKLPSLEKNIIKINGSATWEIMCMNIKCPMNDVWANGFIRNELAIKAWNTRVE